ncbi:uncharacterized protein MONOS_183 [Monocercomonoides exilis]|uniref:uncharacterized protein n=1 Tax=Monocercomonoides exilis TaxID=2049356 RepID=UPI00355AC6ED|nr:hypothetical protein MONOS_183 [Monocercomonoides exilis]|eukprot:MONOS_183.1-p1 / transcript=MONOS_183.1 / gene=MONOS_183 / organism=Monocercomonoides_exilis_PA203 / gene_product=unspecified product / transcript_product=unspecified product / location=Mono_scaffold00003:165269-167656(+) / protein_length=707 / sequence_SO=supercontig / SO=protein_coding / is_pseudo=false
MAVAFNAVKATGVPITGVEVENVVSATKESLESSDKICHALVSRFGCTSLESRLKASIVLVACMERGHPSFREQVRSQSELLHKFASQPPPIRSDSDKANFAQYQEQSKMVLNQMYEKGKKQVSVYDDMSGDSFLRDMESKAQGIGPLRTLEGVGSAALEPIDGEKKGIVGAVMGTVRSAIDAMTGGSSSSSAKFGINERVDSSFKITGDPKAAAEQMPDFRAQRAAKEMETKTLAPRKFGGFDSEETANETITLSQGAQQSTSRTAASIREGLSASMGSDASSSMGSYSSGPATSTYVPTSSTASSLAAGSGPLPDVRSTTGDMEVKLVDEACVAAGVGSAPPKQVMNHFIETAKRSDLTFVTACLADKCVDENAIVRGKAFFCLAALTDPSFVALRPTIMRLVIAQKDAVIEGAKQLTNAAAKQKAALVLERIGITGVVTVSPSPSPSPVRRVQSSSVRRVAPASSSAANTAAQSNSSSAGGDDLLISLDWASQGSTNAPSTSTAAPTTSNTSSSSAANDITLMFGGSSSTSAAPAASNDDPFGLNSGSFSTPASTAGPASTASAAPQTSSILAELTALTTQPPTVQTQPYMNQMYPSQQQQQQQQTQIPQQMGYGYPYPAMAPVGMAQQAPMNMSVPMQQPYTHPTQISPYVSNPSPFVKEQAHLVNPKKGSSSQGGSDSAFDFLNSKSDDAFDFVGDLMKSN